jgi:hypothetical protein
VSLEQVVLYTDVVPTMQTYCTALKMQDAGFGRPWNNSEGVPGLPKQIGLNWVLKSCYTCALSLIPKCCCPFLAAARHD